MAKKRNYSVKDIASWKFKDVGMPTEWVEHLGTLTENFRMIIVGKSGHGKTEYAMQLTKMLAQYYGKVNYNSTEQGRSASFQAACNRNGIAEIEGGKWMLCRPELRTFKPWFEDLKRPNSGRVILLDSIDYMKLTIDEYKQAHERFKHKSLITVGWSEPMDVNTKKIRYMCDIKVEVENYKAHIASRFGGNKVWDIWPDRKKTTIAVPELPSAPATEEPRKPEPAPSSKVKKVKELVRVEKYHDTNVLIYEDQEKQLTLQTAAELFNKYPEVTEIHELHEVWGGRWGRKSTLAEFKPEGHAPESN